MRVVGLVLLLQVLADFLQLLLHGPHLHLGFGVVCAVTLVGKPGLHLEGNGKVMGGEESLRLELIY